MQTSVRQMKQKVCLRNWLSQWDIPQGEQQHLNWLFLDPQLCSLQALTSTTFRHTNKLKVTATLFLFIPFLQLGATGKRVEPKQQSLWMNTAFSLDLMMESLPCLWLCTSWDSSLLSLFTACFAWQSGFRFLSFFPYLLDTSVLTSAQPTTCLRQEAQKRSPPSNYFVSFLNHLKQRVLMTFWLNTSLLLFLFHPRN